MLIQQAAQVTGVDDFNIGKYFFSKKKEIKHFLRLAGREIKEKKLQKFLMEKGFNIIFKKTINPTSDTYESYILSLETDEDFIVIDIFEVNKKRECGGCELYFSNLNSKMFNEFIDFIKKNKTIKRKVKSTHISMIFQDENGNFKPISLNSAKGKKFVIDNIYNDNVISELPSIISSLKNKEGKGLYLFHGIPGTGKTSFIKYLSQKVDNKHFIFIPNDMIGFITSPSFIPFLARNQGAVLILEDAEETLIARDTGRNVAISNILNITDGILSDLGIQIIATFNTKLINIDKALLRAGRLKANIEFKALSIEKANALLKEQGKEETTKEITLAEVFNKAVIEEEQKSIGFKIA